MIDRNHALSVAVQAAKEAGACITRGFNGTGGFSVKTDPADRVTATDIEAQEGIVRMLTEQFPECSILSEEAEGGTIARSAEERFVIDPLDGTSNFTQKLPHVATSIALQQQGESVAGVLFFPVLNELYTAVQGQGAFLNGEPVQVQSCGSMRDAYIAEIFSDRMHRGAGVRYPPCTAYRKFGSAVTALAYLARGSVHAVALHCSLWDVAAADILIREAGGRIECSWNGEDHERGTLTCIAAVPGIFEEFKAYAETQYSGDLPR
ncbi:MAG: hypothetical protein PHU04_04755 [Candidatus Peribacteraceae bacterium]|nr:hypothetical protein [Candidatus Peribacteraceae bacterium]